VLVTEQPIWVGSCDLGSRRGAYLRRVLDSMRVVYITMQFPSPTETFAGADVRALLDAGVEVEVYALRQAHEDHDTMLRERGLEGVPVDSLRKRDLARGIGLAFVHPRWAAALLWWIVRWNMGKPLRFVRCLVLAPRALTVFAAIATRRFDVVHLFWGHYPSMVGHLVQRFLPEVVSSVFLGAYDLDEGRYGSWLPGSAVVARRADLVWTHSVTNVPRLLSFGVPKQKLTCVYRGIDLHRFSVQALGDANREPGLVVAIGSLIERKAVDDVIRVIARVRESTPHVRLRVLGDGPERASLRGLAHDLGVDEIVSFDGHVSGDVVATALARASCFLLMSRNDRIPNVAKEAMAIGCPVVVTNTPGMDELVTHRRTGYCVAVGDVDGAARHVTAILLDPTEHAAMTAAARYKVEQDFSVEASMARYVAAWREAVVSRTRR